MPRSVLWEAEPFRQHLLSFLASGFWLNSDNGKKQQETERWEERDIAFVVPTSCLGPRFRAGAVSLQDSSSVLTCWLVPLSGSNFRWAPPSPDLGEMGFPPLTLSGCFHISCWVPHHCHSLWTWLTWNLCPARSITDTNALWKRCPSTSPFFSPLFWLILWTSGNLFYFLYQKSEVFNSDCPSELLEKNVFKYHWLGTPIRDSDSIDLGGEEMSGHAQAEWMQMGSIWLDRGSTGPRRCLLKAFQVILICNQDWEPLS